jgi:hypothetical protein
MENLFGLYKSYDIFLGNVLFMIDILDIIYI